MNMGNVWQGGRAAASTCGSRHARRPLQAESTYVPAEEKIALVICACPTPASSRSR
jgi:hypothetical protein